MLQMMTGTERLRNLPEVTQLVSAELRYGPRPSGPGIFALNHYVLLPLIKAHWTGGVCSSSSGFSYPSKSFQKVMSPEVPEAEVQTPSGSIPRSGSRLAPWRLPPLRPSLRLDGDLSLLCTGAQDRPRPSCRCSYNWHHLSRHCRALTACQAPRAPAHPILVGRRRWAPG